MAGHLLLVLLMYSLHEIKVQGQKPQMSVQPFFGDHLVFTCSLPGSANNNATCNLYVGAESRPVISTIWKKRASATKQRSCDFTVRTDDLLTRLHFVQQKDASCDYSSESEPSSLSPRSDGYSLSGLVDSEGTQKPPQQTGHDGFWRTSPYTLGAGQEGVSEAEEGDGAGVTKTTSLSSSSTFTPVLPATPVSDKKMLVIVTICGLSVGIILLGSAILSALKRTGENILTSGKCVCLRPQANVTGKSKYGCGYMGSLNSGEHLLGGHDETYSIVTYKFCNIE